MRVALWLLALFGIAAAVALFAGNNQGTITVFWPPWRVDLSLNLVLLLLFGAFAMLHLALRGLSALFSLPRQARQWRMQQKERALHAALLDAMSQLMAGRFSRARKAALAALTQERTLAALDAPLPQAQQVRVLSHLLAAESAQALQDRAARDAHLQQALNESVPGSGLASPETREGVQLRAARWALEDRDAPAALARPRRASARCTAPDPRAAPASEGGAAGRRTLEAPRNRPVAGQAPRVFRSRRKEHRARTGNRPHLRRARPAQLRSAWAQLDIGEREMPEVAIHAAQGWLRCGATWRWPVPGCCRCGTA